MPHPAEDRDKPHPKGVPAPGSQAPALPMREHPTGASLRHLGPPAEPQGGCRAPALATAMQPGPLDARPLECMEAAGCPRARTYKARQRKAGRRARKAAFSSPQPSGVQPWGLEMGQDPHLTAPCGTWGHRVPVAPLGRPSPGQFCSSAHQTPKKHTGGENRRREVAGLCQGQESGAASAPGSVPPKGKALLTGSCATLCLSFPRHQSERLQEPAACLQLRQGSDVPRHGSTKTWRRMGPGAAPARKP